VHPTTGVITLVTKVKSGASGIYEAPAHLVPGTTSVFVKAGTLAIPAGSPQVTAGSVHPSGRGVLLRTYSHLYFAPMRPEQSVAQALAAPLCTLPVAREEQGEAVAWLSEALKQLARDEPDANVALVARFPQQADVYFDGLSRAEVPNVRRVAKQDFSWDPGVDVTDVRQTKGLEFDEVVLLETTAASYPETPQARHALYVAATRASHQLWCVASDVPSKLVSQAVAADKVT